MTAALRLTAVAKAFGGAPVLRDVTLDVAAGELLAILGASGSGKTTLLRLLGGFERADAGTIAVDGAMVGGPGVHVPPERRRIGYVAQEGALFPHLSVGANVLFGLPAASRRDPRRAAALLERVGLTAGYAARAPHTLSGGEQQRVALARALAPQPRVVLLDEPFSALDAALRVETRAAVVAALRAAGTTALLVTHDQAEALSTGRRVAVLRHGGLAQVATPDILYRRPADAALGQFVGEAVMLPGTVAGDEAACALGVLRLAVPLAAGEADLLVRPEQIRLLAEACADGVRATVVGSVYYGHDARVTLRLDNDGRIVTARVSGHVVPRPGDVVGVAVEGAVMAYPRTSPARRPIPVAALASVPPADIS